MKSEKSLCKVPFQVSERKSFGVGSTLPSSAIAPRRIGRAVVRMVREVSVELRPVVASRLQVRCGLRQVSGRR